MFEKEAKDYKEIVMKEHLQNPFPRSVEDVWQDGAAFGYNKANEWHFVKDGDLPKEENLECLCIIRPMKEEDEPFEPKDFRGVLYFRNGRFYLDEDNDNDCFNSDFTKLVIAWQEIILPELPKESE